MSMRFPLLSVLCVGLTAATSSSLSAQAPAASPAPPEGMVLIPAGEFWMGTDRDDGTNDNQGTNTPLSANDARPRHRATTGAFYIDKTEVTCEQYKKFCDATGYAVPPDWKDGQFPEGKAKVPVSRVNWYEASAYAKWIDKRLPTEAEWEKAAGGTEGRQFPWGDNWDPGRVVYSTGGPLEVGSHPNGATPEGVLDMSGNVFEWTASWFDAYRNAPTKQPDFGTKLKVVRGGAWLGSPDLFMNWHRAVNRPQSRIEWIGFRCVKDAN
jgi:formylglycine-generating enzyme required for sulfatase activity